MHMWCCRSCGRRMQLVRAFPDATAMAPGYEYQLSECPGGHGQKWRRVFNAPLMVEYIRRPRAPARSGAAAKTAAIAARELWMRSGAMLTGIFVLLPSTFF